MSFTFLDKISFSKPTLGATVTTINSSDQLSDFPTVYNANLNALNNGKFELTDWFATTTHTNMASLPSLATVGTIGTGVWEGTAVGDDYGGTGQSTYTTGDILYASGANTLAKLAIGSNGQSLIISGGVPSWASASVDETQAYNWTGLHSFAATTTHASSTFARVGIGLTNPLYPLHVAGDSYITGGLGIGTTATATDGDLTVSGVASTSALVISTTCLGCPTEYTSSSTAFSVSSGSTNYANNIPGNSNMAVCAFEIDGADGTAVDHKGDAILFRAGKTTSVISVEEDATSGSVEAQYTLTWSGSTLTVAENAEPGTTSITGTCYWYK